MVNWKERGSQKAMAKKWKKAAEAAEKAEKMVMTPAGETTLEDEIIYSPEIAALIEEALDGLATDRSKRLVLESLVYRSIRSWTGE